VVAVVVVAVDQSVLVWEVLVAAVVVAGLTTVVVARLV
jgi:hypothetical protein